jgi:FAD dependent oxidoreductase
MSAFEPASPPPVAARYPNPMRAVAVLLLLASLAPAATHTFDVVVYGGTAGGIIAAVSAARQGLRTALIEPTAHIGGMVSGGLGRTDYGKKEVIGGYALEFYWRVGQHYQMSRYGQDLAWLLEPHVAEAIFRQMLRESGVTLYEGTRLAEQSGVRKNAAALTALVMENGDEFSARIFIDAGYEGDVMAQSGITWTYGREAQSQYGESLAGVRDKTPFHQFLLDIPARGPDGHLLPEISPDRPAAPGSADKRVQAYNFRMCLCEDPARQAAFPKPAAYDPARYTLLARLIHAIETAEHRPPALARFMNIDRLPNGATDVNNNGAFSTDFIGASWTYPTATYAARQRIWQAHKDYQSGFFYFLAHDPQVPDSLRAEMNRWGLCKDEFTDTGNWPRQLYIRESRRMVGPYVMRQQDLQTDLAKPDPIGMGSYNSDSHNVERIVDAGGFVRNEGDMQVAVKPYQIPYRILVPQRGEATNLLVTAAFSATHVAYSSVRMEPQYMILGQAAGVAAKLAIAANQPVQDIDTAELTKILRGQGAIMEYAPNAQSEALQLVRRNLGR